MSLIPLPTDALSSWLSSASPWSSSTAPASSPPPGGTALAVRLAAYTSRTLDTLRAATAPTPELQSLFAKEESLFEEV